MADAPLDLGPLQALADEAIATWTAREAVLAVNLRDVIAHLRAHRAALEALQREAFRFSICPFAVGGYERLRDRIIDARAVLATVSDAPREGETRHG